MDLLFSLLLILVWLLQKYKKNSHYYVLKAKAEVFKFYWILYICGIYYGYQVISYSNLEDKLINLELTIVGGVFALIFFIQKQKLEEAILFKDHFKEFNARYDLMNEALAKIDSIGVLTDREKEILIDYYNLCAEEYVVYMQGYIPIMVWESWIAGMAYYWENPKIKAHWQKEMESMSQSFYGFDLKKQIELFKSI